MRRISLISLLLCIVFVLSACNRQEIPTPPGESSQPDDSSSAESKTFTLMYCMSDSLNPYASKTLVNNHITNLLYEPLIKLDEHLKPVYALASNVIINENHCVVTIKNAVFSDGTPLTPDDVVYSIKCAMSSDTPYSVSLKNILNCSVASSDSVSIILKKHDPYFVNLLDFPIIKQYSDTLKDENDLEIPPTGVGRYQIDTKNRVLKANAKFYGGEPKIKEILLTNTPDAEAMNHNIEVGRVDAFFSDLSDNKIPKMTGVNQSVHLNRLIYMGINMKNPVLAIHQIRYALSAAINRTELCNKAFFSYAQPANGPFPSFWQDAKGFQTIENINNSNIYIANLKEIGYNSKDVQGFYLADNKTRLSFKLLVNSENTSHLNAANQIKEQLQAAGIEITITEAPYEAYIAALKAETFDLYLADVNLLNNMDITELITPKASLAYGIVPPKKPDPAADTSSSSGLPQDNIVKYLSTAEAVAAFYKAEASLSDIVSAFNAEMPFIPLCHRDGISIYSKKLSVGPISTISDVFYNIENCTFK